VRWTPRLSPGTYRARLLASALGGPVAQITSVASATVTVRAPAPPPPAPLPFSRGVFPVQGSYTFGGPDARFGAVRAGHIHQGQDVIAAAGTPVVAPVAGTITVRAYQAGGAGNYVVLHAADGTDYVFMHFQDGSTVVQVGQAVAPGEQIARVGATGDATGPHLHFEIWPDGWQKPGSSPIDPLPVLEAWAAS
jgi:murein DD-endopeptidase MepM/ murein hydrolase activator NlpD